MEKYFLLMLADLLIFGLVAPRGRLYVPVPLLVGLGTGLFQAAAAGRQRRQARRMQPSSFIPPALREAEGSASREAMATRYPGQDVDEANVRQTATDAFHNVARSSSSPSATVNAASRLAGFQQREMRRIGAEARRFRANATDRLRQIQLRKAGVQAENRRQFEAAKSALRGASSQNLFNAISSIGAGAVVSHLEGGRGGGGQGLFTTNPVTGMPERNPMLSSMLYNPTAFSLGFSRYNNPYRR